MKSNLAGRISQWSVRNACTVKEIVGAFLEAIYQGIKRGDSVSLRGFGSFYVWPHRDSRVFRFDLS